MKTGDIVKHYSESKNQLGIIKDFDAGVGCLVWFPRANTECFVHMDELESVADWKDVENFIYA